MRSHVVCVGQLMTDVVARLPGPLATGSDTPASVTFLGGGAAANVAAWLATAGTRATFVGCVGDDLAGRLAVEELQADGVEVMVGVDGTRPTGTCIVLVDASGERTMIPDLGANAGLGERDPLTCVPVDADQLYVSGYSLLDPHARPFAVGAIELARSRGLPVAVDAASAAPLAQAGPRALDGWAGGGVLLFANDDEAEVLCRRRGPAAARALALRFGETVVKSGAAGATWSDGRREVSGPEVVRAVDGDTTGAGDAFAAGYLAARASGAGVEESMAAAAGLAARAVGVRGARPARDRA